MSEQLKGRPVAKAIYNEVRTALEKAATTPCLHVLMVGDDPASQYYVGNISKRAAKVGINVEVESLPADVSRQALLQRIEALNADAAVHGVMVQKPLPSHIDTAIVDAAVNPAKDVDGAHPLNVGRLALDRETLVPATAQAVLEILRHYGIHTAGRNVTILGRSAVIGRPLANLLLYKNEPGNATVTVCHSRTRDLAAETRRADILVAAIGRPRFVSADMVREGTVVIDVGVNQIEEGGASVYVGDVDYTTVTIKASAITPVPGGVGTVTTACLVRNVYYAWQRMKKIDR
ncbi:MAG: bifunctional 5,10-methylenetetrahydrofolate dehydrogenase/5,10-methenyltetrahydrofolate cyclohydrolase [Candidatus Cloacimonetes bacterium]|nr:bifunctional 5,10-methylenetetrahydrofolate dehydrogenase/5,10-methenyltetrahydrofolate cyclohydrolase [Candidatus Cloacimonadota bacterium]